jgi:hypothetical protein
MTSLTGMFGARSLHNFGNWLPILIKRGILKGYKTELRYLKMAHGGVQYRAVYDTDELKKEVLVVFLGSRENFYKELHRFIH